MHEQNVSQHISRRYAHTIRRYALYVRRFPRACPRMNIATVLRERAIDSADQSRADRGRAGWSRLPASIEWRPASHVNYALLGFRPEIASWCSVRCRSRCMPCSWASGAAAQPLSFSTPRPDERSSSDVARLASPQAVSRRASGACFACCVAVHPAHPRMSSPLGDGCPARGHCRIDEGD